MSGHFRRVNLLQDGEELPVAWYDHQAVLDVLLVHHRQVLSVPINGGEVGELGALALAPIQAPFLHLLLDHLLDLHRVHVGHGAGAVLFAILEAEPAIAPAASEAEQGGEEDGDQAAQHNWQDGGVEPAVLARVAEVVEQASTASRFLRFVWIPCLYHNLFSQDHLCTYLRVRNSGNG